MGFPIGMLETVARKSGTFGNYEVRGALVTDTQLKKGWYIDLEGVDSGSFAVCDGEIHPSGRHLLAGPNDSTFAPVSSDIAQLPSSAEQTIFDAIAKWESEEREIPRV